MAARYTKPNENPGKLTYEKWLAQKVNKMAPKSMQSTHNLVFWSIIVRSRLLFALLRWIKQALLGKIVQFIIAAKITNNSQTPADNWEYC